MIYVVDIHPNLPGVKVLTDLGARPSKTVSEFPVSYAEEISLETVAEYDADVIFVSAADAQSNPQTLELLGTTFAGERDQVFPSSRASCGISRTSRHACSRSMRSNAPSRAAR